MTGLTSSPPGNDGATFELGRRSALGLVAATALGMVPLPIPASPASSRLRFEVSGLEHLIVRHRRIAIEGQDIFYREAGRPDAPAVLLLHGFPTSSHMFRHLIPALADRYRVVAPDYPGFGQSASLDRRFRHSFETLARIVEAFTDAVRLTSYAIYIQDYGAPIGLRLALARPDRVQALIIQNGNAYEEGLSEGWTPLRAYWSEPTAENRAELHGWLNAEGVRLQYVAGAPEGEIERFAPESWVLDWHRMAQPGSIDYQLDLFGDYKSNVDLYPAFQAFFRERRPPALIAWGRYDPFFTVQGAEAYLRDLPDAELHFVDAGHFALESHAPDLIALIRDFLGRRVS